MSNDIAKMNDKQLRNEVQLLRDELAIMKRKFEDLFYNLDTDNFSSRFVKEQGDMRTAIEVTAEGIKTKVSNEEFESAKTQLADKITSEVTKLDGSLSTKITQTASEINSRVDDVEDELYSEITQTADEIGLRVRTVEGKTNSISVNNNEILIDGNKTKIKSVVYLTDSDGNNSATLYYSLNDGKRLYLNSTYNPDGSELDYIIIGDSKEAYDYDTNTYENSHNVYVAEHTKGWKVATEGWVKNKIQTLGGGTAKFA